MKVQTGQKLCLQFQARNQYAHSPADEKVYNLET